MNDSALRRRLLEALLSSCQNNEITDLFDLSERAGADLRRTLAALDALSRGGWVDVRRLRLTLAGFALAHALAGAGADRGAVAARGAVRACRAA